MGDFSPFDDLRRVDDGEAAGAAAFGGGVTFRVPEIAAWCVAAVPFGSSASAEIFAGGPVDSVGAATGFETSPVAVLGARRHRLNNPSMHSPANYWLWTSMLTAAVLVDVRCARSCGATDRSVFSERQDSSNQFKVIPFEPEIGAQLLEPQRQPS